MGKLGRYNLKDRFNLKSNIAILFMNNCYSDRSFLMGTLISK